MPELPEVETTRQGIKPHIENKSVQDIVIRQPKLRWPVTDNLVQILHRKTVLHVSRRGKYLLIGFDIGTLIIHLGMSGRLCVIDESTPPQKHDHVDLIFHDGTCLRYTDPRRFGAILFTHDSPDGHPLIKTIGPEPLSGKFNADYLWEKANGKATAIKNFIMDSHIVAGVGNIYATEALFAAGIKPAKAAGKITYQQCHDLVTAIKAILSYAISQGGTTLKDFTQSNGKPGYFKLALQAYGKSGEPCPRCTKPLRNIILGQRATVYCTQCQK